MTEPAEMDALYRRDLPDWTEQQAGALRALAGRPDLHTEAPQ